MCSSGIEGVARHWSPLHSPEKLEIQSAANDRASAAQPETFNFFAAYRLVSSATPRPADPLASIGSSRRAVIEIRGQAHNQAELRGEGGCALQIDWQLPPPSSHAVRLLPRGEKQERQFSLLLCFHHCFFVARHPFLFSLSASPLNLAPRSPVDRLSFSFLS